MLVLVRKAQERIYLERNGERIEVVVVKVAGNIARIGIVADKSWDVFRDNAIKRKVDK